MCVLPCRSHAELLRKSFDVCPLLHRDHAGVTLAISLDFQAAYKLAKLAKLAKALDAELFFQCTLDACNVIISLV